MAPKKDSPKPQDDLAPADFTSSVTDTENESLPEGSLSSRVEAVVGAEPLAKSAAGGAMLLRLFDGLIKPNLSAALSVPVYQPRRRTDDVRIPVIIGPYDQAMIRRLAEEGLLNAQDAVQASYGRWKPVKEVFAEFMDSQGTDEVTDTLTAPTTNAGIYDTDEATTTEESQLELESVEEAKVPAPTAASARSDEIVPANATALGLETDDVEEAPAKSPAKPMVITGGAAAPRTAPTASVRPVATTGSAKKAGGGIASWAPTVGAAVVIGAGLFFVIQKQRGGGDHAASPAETTELVNAMPQYPANLRPLPPEKLHEDDGPLVARIRPILNAYESGTTALSVSDERILKEAADPASASFEARRLAGNQLAVFYLANSRIEDARRTLNPILEASASDATTLLNMALLQLTGGELADARETATAALRLTSPANSWLAYSVVGLIEGYRNRIEQAETYFRDALRRSPNNPFVYGLFIRTLSEHPSGAEKIPPLIREALWNDPDRLLDSPIRAPLAGHILVSFALEGLSRGAEMRESRLSNGKKAFVKWLEARYRRNPLSQPLSRVTEALAQEADPQSQLLYAFALREQGQLDPAAEVMNRVIPLLQNAEDQKSSWAWSFAGDIQYARRNVSQGIVFYQSALSRNAQDIAAVLGMALAFREKGEYKLAEQKLSEALSLDPSFIPALLRVSRFEWHRGYGP